MSSTSSLVDLVDDTNIAIPCRGSDDWSSNQRDVRASAADRCFDCPLMLSCEQTAEARGEGWGVWGGRDFGEKPAPTGNSSRDRAAAERLDTIRAMRKANATRQEIAAALGVGIPTVDALLKRHGLTKQTNPVGRMQLERQIICLRDDQELTWMQVGAALNMHHQTAHRYYQRAMERGASS